MSERDEIEADVRRLREIEIESRKLERAHIKSRTLSRAHCRIAHEAGLLADKLDGLVSINQQSESRGEPGIPLHVQELNAKSKNKGQPD